MLCVCVCVCGRSGHTVCCVRVVDLKTQCAVCAVGNKVIHIF